MIILYDKDTTEFGSTLGLGVLKDAITCEPSEEINGTYEVEMTYPIEGLHAKDLIIDNIIYTNVNPFEPDNRQAFRIYSVSKPINGILTINAQHISYDATKLIIYPATEGLTNKEKAKLTQDIIDDAKNAVIANETIKSRYNIIVSVPESYDKTADITYTSPVSLRYFLANQIISGYEVELEFDNYKTTIVEKRGEDRGVVLNYGKNIEDIEETKSTNTTCSAIYPYYWKSSSTTSSGVNYAYQTLKIDSSLPEKSYDWLYSETSSGTVGKIRAAITSTIKSYIFKEEISSNLYLWDTYSYINVSDIDDWEMASSDSTSSDVVNQVFNVLDNIVPITGIISTFSKSKEKMKAVLSVFKLYYGVYTKNSEYKGIEIVKTALSGKNSYTFSLNGFDQNLTNITIYGDPTYGTKKLSNDKVMDNACFVEIGETRLYCGYQVNSNLYYNNFLYIGPKEGAVPVKSFFKTATGSTAWDTTDKFIKNKYMVLIYNAKESTYNNTIFIPRVKDTIEEDYSGKDHTGWSATDLGHHIYYTTEEGVRKYKYYDSDNSKLVDLSSDSLVCNEDKWTKIMTVKGLDPAYPSTSGETTTKTEKAVLNSLGTYYANNAYTNSASIVQYQESFWLYSDSKWQSNDSTILSADDTRLFVINGKADPYYTFRGGNYTKYSTETGTDNILSVKKLPTSDIKTGKLYIKETGGAAYEYYISEIVNEKSKWVKLTLTSVPTNSVYVYGDSNKSYYKSDFTSLAKDDTIYTDPDNLPQTGSADTLYVVEMTNDQNPNLDPYKGCIFLDKSYINNSNILIQPVDLTSLIDEKNDELFTGIDLESTVPANMQKTGKLLLDFIKEYYITKEENNPNKLTNETTISYMKIEGDNPLLDYVSLNKVLIGDTVHIRYGKLNISSDLRVKAVTYDAINNRYSEITLGEITETLASSVVTSSDGVSVLANDSGYTNTQDVNKIIAKNVIADKVSTQTFEATQAVITSLDVEQLNANTAKIDSIITDPLEGNATSAMQLSGTIVTSIENASISEKKINYHTNLSYNWDDENRVLTITLGN